MKHYTETEIRNKLAVDEKWVRQALIRLYQRQTADEQTSEDTKHHNLRGFAPCDAKWFTRLAQFVTKNPNKPLSPKQLALCGVRAPGFEGRVRMWRDAPSICKYAGQLLKVIEEDKQAKESQ